MTMNRHEPFEELISASLNGELNALERQRLDAHLDSCAGCRDTLAAFAEQRRIMAGLRHVAPPRDLGARVRYGIERGRRTDIPWWRRPAVMFAGIGGGLAAVAGALLALVLLNGMPDDPQVGAGTPTPSAVAPSPSEAPPSPTPPLLTQAPQATEPPAPTLPPNPSPGQSAPPPPTPDPAVSPTPEPSPEPDVFLAVTGEPDNLAMTVQEPQPAGESPAPEPITAVAEAPAGPPIAAELSPDGQWLGYVTEVGLSGMAEVSVTRVADAPEGEDAVGEVGERIVLGQTLVGSPFLERLLWSPDSRRLAYTLADPEADGATDAWLFLPATGEFGPLTDVGSAFAASWIPPRDDADADADADAPPLLWVSLAGDRPSSHLVELAADDELAGVDLADAVHAVEDVFLPMLSPNGSLAIYWNGRMAQEPGAPWAMVEQGQPWLSEHDVRGQTYEFGNERPLFSDLAEDREMFSSAAIAWGPDGDSYAVWDARWTGVDQGSPEEQYPDALRVYLGHATDPRGLTRGHALDATDLLGEGEAQPAGVIDVKVSPTGRHLVVTVRRPLPDDVPAEQIVPTADLLFVERNTDRVADVVERLNFSDSGWFGPAAFDDSWMEASAD
jgi:putative zinc finger protein